jgi:hypothetical protein
MVLHKGPGRHPTTGTFYVRSLCVLVLSATALSVVRWPEDSPLLVLGVLSLVAAFIGRAARRYCWPNGTRWHVIGMSVSYILLITAFYVDNGKFLPVWNQVPPLWLWVLPAIVGIPLVVIALSRHASARHHE